MGLVLMKFKLFIFVFILCLSLTFVNATESSIGTFQKDENITLIQLCGDCTYITITSVLSPDFTELISNINMSKDGTEFSYLLDGGNTSDLGTYTVNGVGDLRGNSEIWVYTFDITPNGEELSTTKIIIQVGLLFFLLVFFFFSLIGIFKVDNYVGRFTLYWICHVLLISITFISWQMASDFLTGTPMIAGMFKIVFYFFMIGAFPMVLLSLSWIFYIHTMNDDIKNLMERGMDEGEAYDRSRRKTRW